jgi:flagellin-like protein
MDLKKLFDTEDRAVSPVIGVILMVAITVILAAVIGAFVLGLGDQASSSAPQATINWEFTNNATISHGGGQDITTSEITILVDGTEVYPDSSPDLNTTTGWDASTVSTGDEVTIYHESAPTTDVTASGNTISVIWNNPSGGSSNILSERKFP